MDFKRKWIIFSAQNPPVLSALGDYAGHAAVSLLSCTWCCFSRSSTVRERRSGQYVAMDRYRCRARASRTFILTGESGRTGMALLFPCFNFIVCSVLFFFSHCAVYLQGLFGSRPSRQFIGQAEISAPDDQNRTPGSAVWPRQLCRGSNQTAPC